MKDILEEIVAHKRREIEARKATLTESRLRAAVERECHDTPPSMAQAQAHSATGIIAEFKRKSPSRGWIKADADPATVPLDYQKHGAAAISILTDRHFFGGADEFVTIARRSGVTLPILYKNFVIDAYQLLEARICGASAALLIAACLSKAECASLIGQAHSLGMEVLLEMHAESELEYATLGPDMCGINNRNLGTFETSTDNSFRLAALLPDDAIKVSESGISSPATVAGLRRAGFSGFLIGESFMKSGEPGAALGHFINGMVNPKEAEP